MKIKDILVSVFIVLIGVWLARRLFFYPTENKNQNLENTTFIAPERAEFAEPLQLDVDFTDVTPDKQPAEDITEITTNYGSWLFSTYGGSVKQIRYNHAKGASIELIKLFDQKSAEIPFLVALDGLGATPYFYQLVDKKSTSNATMLLYQSQNDQLIINKQFIVYHDTYQLDLNLSLIPKEDIKLHTKARIFIPAPTATDTRGLAGLSAVFYDNEEKLASKPMKDIGRLGKLAPTLLGIESHYFVNIMVQDPNNFAQRGYFKVVDNDAMAILQSALINDEKTWHLTFYCGPKEVQALGAVSDNLTSLISYGWFSPLSRGMLVILNFFNKLFNSYGLAIILLTILINIILLPFRWQSQKKTGLSEAEKRKKLQYIEQKYKHDQEKLYQARLKFTQQHFGTGLGSWILLIQFPLFIALNKLLTNAFELYQEPFLWIASLSAQDPYYILPILAGLAIAGTLIMQSTDPKQVVTYLILGIIIAAIFATFSAGLLLFIIISTLFSVAQNYIQKRIKS